MAKKLAEKLVGSVEIDIGDGKKWPIAVTNRVIMEIEDTNPGMNLLSGDSGSILKPTMRTLSTVLFEVLKRSGAKYTFDEVVDRVHPGNMKTLQTGILVAWGNSVPTEEQIKALDPTPAAEAATTE